MIYRWCPLKWTNAKINILMCNANKSDVSTKVGRQKKGSLSASKSINILIKEYDLTGTLYLNRIKAMCPLKWTN